jgi:hypothetical protein
MVIPKMMPLQFAAHDARNEFDFALRQPSRASR